MRDNREDPETAPTANPPWAWSWRFWWRSRKLKGHYEPNLGGYLFPLHAKPEHRKLIKSL